MRNEIDTCISGLAYLTQDEKVILDRYHDRFAEEVEKLAHYFPTGIPRDIRDIIQEEITNEIQGLPHIFDQLRQIYQVINNLPYYKTA